jgi:hypothetical protein
MKKIIIISALLMISSSAYAKSGHKFPAEASNMNDPFIREMWNDMAAYKKHRPVAYRHLNLVAK